LKGKVARKAAGIANSPMVEDIVLPGCIARTSSHKDVIAAKEHSAAAARGGVRRVASDGTGLLPQQQQLPSSTSASNGLSLPDVSGGRRSNNMAAGSSGSGSSKMVGLSNLGNTCFMNSSLQCLLYTTPLIQYFQQGRHKQDLNPSAPCKGLVASAYAKFVGDVAASSGTLSPKEFKRVLTKHAPHLLDYQQQDCQEFLRFLLDNMSEDLCRKSSLADGGANAVTASCPTSVSPDKKMAALGAEMGALGIGTSGEQQEPTSTSPNSSGSGEKNKFSQRLRNQVSASALLSEEDDGGCDRGGAPAGDEGELLASGGADAAAATANSRVVYDGGGGIPGALAAPPATKRPTNNSFRARAASSAASLLGMSSTAPEPPAMSPSEEASKAWANYLRHNDSIVTDIFAGQMQSTVECMTCGHKSKSYDPFLDLSVPVPRPASEGAGDGGDVGGGAEGGGKPKMGGTLPARRRGNATRHKTELSKCKLSDCLDKFSATEMLDDDNLPTCDRCKKKRRCTKTLSVYRHPQVLVIHIKRFSYTTVSRDKMETDVSFPSEGLDMSGYLSGDVKDAGVGGGRPAHVHGTAPLYDLVGVCHHMGGLTGGHYTSFVDTSFGSGERKWTHFNDARVSRADVGQVGGPSAYVLFYRIRT